MGLLKLNIVWPEGLDHASWISDNAVQVKYTGLPVWSLVSRWSARYICHFPDRVSTQNSGGLQVTCLFVFFVTDAKIPDRVTTRNPGGGQISDRVTTCNSGGAVPMYLDK